MKWKKVEIQFPETVSETISITVPSKYLMNKNVALQNNVHERKPLLLESDEIKNKKDTSKKYM